MILKRPLEISEQNISYYNGIAGEYNTMLDKTSDRMVREKVAARVSDIIQNSTILDFGGGTGLDLKWLSETNKKIFFCEPSKEMRKIAMSYSTILLNKNIIFLDDYHADFRQWNKQLPFSEKMDAILANFAVLNCIPDTELLFKSLALIIKTSGNMFALILTKDYSKRWKFLSLINRNQPTFINIHYKNYQQTAYLYSLKNIVKASCEYFSLCGAEVFKDADFTLIHLKRK